MGKAPLSRKTVNSLKDLLNKENKKLEKVETIEQQTRKIISKQGTATLVSKLEKGTLLGISKDIALEVLKKRGTPFIKEESIKEDLIPTLENKVTKPVEKKQVGIVKSPILKTETDQSPKKEVVKPVSETSLVKDVLRLKESGESIYSIRKKLNVSWSRVSNILNKNSEQPK